MKPTTIETRIAVHSRFAPSALIAILSVFLTIAGDALAASAPRESVIPAFRYEIPNIPGKSVVAALVTYPPGGKTPPHHHAGSAFVTAYMLSGAVRSQVDGGKIQIFHAGENWTEMPGAHHTVSENASDTEPASFLAVSVVDTND